MAAVMSELELIRRIRRAFPRNHRAVLVGIGDDALVLRGGMVVSTDAFVDGVHFIGAATSYLDIGARCMAGALSDLAAMAAEPVCALVALCLPKRTAQRNVDDLYRGFRIMASRYRCDISGGDMVASRTLVIAITVIGRTRRPLLRSGARAGQRLWCTGFLGLAETGRQVLNRHGDARVFRASVQRHRRPFPRIKEALTLRRWARAGIDTSDGLSTDALHLAEESDVGIVLHSAAIPVHPEVARYCRERGLDPIDYILSAGEDYELLFTTARVPRSPDVALAAIGEVVRRRGLYLERQGRARRIDATGYQHLA